MPLEVAELLRMHADRVAASVGVPLLGWAVLAAPCEGHDNRWNLSGHAQLPLDEAEHPAALARLRDAWSRLGHEVNGSSALSPDDQIVISVQSTRPPTALALLLLSPCYPAGGEQLA